MWSDSARRGSHESLRASAEHKARERILEIGFDYIGGYTDSDGKVFVRCRKCGNVFEAAYQPIRKRGMITCPVCCDAERAEREELKRLERDAAAIKKMMLSYRKHIEAEKAKAKAHAKRVHRCPICGKPAERTLCCSDDCTRKYVNRVKDQRRRAKITDALVDADIQGDVLVTLEAGTPEGVFNGNLGEIDRCDRLDGDLFSAAGDKDQESQEGCVFFHG